MLRSTFVRALRAPATFQAPKRAYNAKAQTLLQRTRTFPLASSLRSQTIRCYSAAAGLNQEEVQGRIMSLLKNFDKVTDASKVNYFMVAPFLVVNDVLKISSTSNFSKDLGLDSLDTVEVVMAIEEEFSIEIPDREADALHSVDQAVTYIMAQPDAH